MTLPLIIYRSLRQHALSTLVTAFNMALACGLLMTVWMLHAREALRARQEHDTDTLALVTVVVALAAAGAVLASIYAGMSARRRDIAILRALGASRRAIFGAVIFEAMVIGALGAVFGFAVHGALMFVAGEIAFAKTGVPLPVFTRGWVLLWAPLGMVALGALGGFIPAVKAYRVPVAQTLSPLS